MKTIVIQRHQGNLEGIAECVAELGENADILYTSDPREVLREARGDEPIFIVSGQVFDHPTSGTDLARAVKRINPNTLFFIYSVMPEWNEAVDGIIPKGYGTLATSEHSLLAQILVSNLDAVTPASLQEAFPQVRIITHPPRDAINARVEKDF